MSDRGRGRSICRDDRAVSITVGFVLNLAIASLLLSALLIGGSGMIDRQTRDVTGDELSVTGQQLAEKLLSADRLVRAGETVDLSIRSDLPTRTAAGSYLIEIEHEDAEGTIELRSTDPVVTTSVRFRSETDVDSATVNGGPVRIAYDPGEDQLVVTSA